MPDRVPPETATNGDQNKLETAIRPLLPLLHRITRRVAPGYRDDGHMTTWMSRHEGVEDSINGNPAAKEVCVGCEIEALLFSGSRSCRL